MAHIKISEGLNLPLKGRPSGSVQNLAAPQEVSLNLNPFSRIKFRLLKKAGDVVKVGEPIAEDKMTPGRYFVSPAAGSIKEVRRGLKRRLMDVVIEVDRGGEDWHELQTLNPKTASREELVDHLKEGGLFAHIRRRPFNLLANPEITPRNVFVKAHESAPCAAPSELQVEGFEREFQAGLDTLAKLTDGKVHLIHAKGSSCKAFTDAPGVEKHTVEGPHPVANISVAIHHIDPIQSCEDAVWTVTAHDVVCIGAIVANGKYHIDRVIGIGGPGILGDRTGFFRVRAGHPVGGLIAGRNEKGLLRLISGDVLCGNKVEVDGFLGFYDVAFTVLPESVDREFMHFFRPGLSKFTATKTYLSGFRKDSEKEYDFSTSLHGEERAFIDGRVYDRMMPMQVPCMELVKSILSEDFDTAEELGLLEVDAEDFALPAFICPSKVEMTEIVRDGLNQYAADVLS